MSEADAYERGKRDGSIASIGETVARAHERLDKHDIRMTALERVMYAGMGVLVMIQLLPELAAWATP